MNKALEAQESIETELDDDHEQILIQCSSPPDIKVNLLKRSSSSRHIGGGIAVILLVIGSLILVVAIVELRKQKSTAGASERKSAMFESGTSEMPQSSFPSMSLGPSTTLTELPSAYQTSNISTFPTSSTLPNLLPFDTSSYTPTMPPTGLPTSFLTALPTEPLSTRSPTSKPVAVSTTSMPAPISRTNTPTKSSAQFPTVAQIATFYVIGDVPYNNSQAQDLKVQMQQIPSDAEFVVHVGDIRFAGVDLPCQRQEYTSVASTMRLSPPNAPVFMLLGDNDYNDCPNPEEGLSFGKTNFSDSRAVTGTTRLTSRPSPVDQKALVFSTRVHCLLASTLSADGYLSWTTGTTDWSAKLTGPLT